MPANIELRPFDMADEQGLIAVWREAMWADPIDLLTWRTRYLLDPNFDPRECLVAIDLPTGSVVAFVFGISQKSPVARLPVPPDAWVVGFGVSTSHRRQGIGRLLMESLESGWRDAGISRIQYGPYIPGYLAPGIDEAAYGDAIHFLNAIGSETFDRSLSMKVSLTGYRANPAVPELTSKLRSKGIVVRPAEPPDTLGLLEFLGTHFPHWRSDAANVLQDLLGGDPRRVSMFVAEDHGHIVGYAQSRDERFGPFGVEDAHRGRGIGAVLLSSVLLSMRAKGFHCAWFLWTSDRAAKLYRDHGFEEVRRFTSMARSIQRQGER